MKADEKNEDPHEHRLASARRLVVKVGSALVTNNGAGLDLAPSTTGPANRAT